MEQESSHLNDYHKQRNKEALEAVEEMLKYPVSSERMREEIKRRHNEPEEEESPEAAEEYKRKVFETSPKRKALFLSLNDFEIQTIIVALDITINKKLSDAENLGLDDYGIKRYTEWRDMAKKWHIGITTIARQPIINSIRRNLIQPIENKKKGCSDLKLSKIYDSQIEDLKALIKKLKFEVADV